MSIQTQENARARTAEEEEQHEKMDGGGGGGERGGDGGRGGGRRGKEVEEEGDKEKSPQGLAFLWDCDCPLWFSTALEHSTIFLNLPTASAGPSQQPGPVGLEAIGG